MPWQKHLPDSELNAVRTAAINASLASDRQLDALQSGLPPHWVASLPGAANPSARLLTELNEMNRVFSLRNGDVPLVKWLENAVALSGDRPGTDVLEAALDKVKLAPDQPPASAPLPDLGAANLDVRPEALLFGLDGTLSVQFLTQALAATRSVCKVMVNRFFGGHIERDDQGNPRVVPGTGWLIGRSLLITNHHVVNARNKGFIVEPDATDADFKLQGDGCKVLFDYFEDPASAHTVSGTLVAHDQDLDFAILRLGPETPSDRVPLRLRQHVLRKNLTQALGTGVNVLQHPGGKPMRLGFRNNFVILGDDRILTYVTDTEAGSSGSPVCDDAWTVAALHSGSRGMSQEGVMVNGAKLTRENFGTAIQAILAKLADAFPALHAEILADQQP